MSPDPSKKSDYRVSERRQATVMFADIAGFTAISEKMDPEEITSLMNQCFSMLGKVVASHSGTIDKYIGDSIMVVFGVPVAIEDAPRKAINTAIEMRKELYGFNKEKRFDKPLDIHIGINTGDVLSGEVGSDLKRDYTVMGDTVNLASRLEEVSETGQILVGPSTYQYTKDHFKYRKLPPVSIKGKEKPVSVYELLSLKEERYRPRVDSSRMVFSEMVGRQRELDKLELQVMKVINGEGSIVNVIGEAGIGKSRLIAELRRREEMKRVILLEGRALSIGKNLSFHPIIDILKNWIGIKEDDTETESLFKLERKMKSIYPDMASESFPFIATLMGMKLPSELNENIKNIESEMLSKLILKSVRELIVKASEIRPLVIVMEDMHWADESSIEMLESLFRLVSEKRVLYINVFRPRYGDTGERLSKTIKERYKDHYLEIILQSLDSTQSEVLTQNLLKTKGVPKQIRNQILERSEGNPFFIEEIVRELIDIGAVEVKKGGFEITDQISSVVIPHSINEVIMSRIDRLDEETKALLKVASIIGRNFFYKILVEVAQSVSKIDSRIEYLKGIQLIRERERMAEIEYLFKHALAQEAIYGSILIKKRKELHINVAQSIELIFKERLHEFYGMLAYHYSQGEDLDKAEEYLIKAGEAASGSAASSEALYYYQRALELYQRKFGTAVNPDKMAMLEKNIAFAYFARGYYPEAVEHIDNALKWLGEKTFKNKVSLFVSVIFSLLILSKTLYIKEGKRKKIPSEKEQMIFDLMLLKPSALAVINSVQSILNSFRLFVRFRKYDLKKIKFGTASIGGLAVAISSSGLSAGISRRIIEYCASLIKPDDKIELYFLKYIKLWSNLFTGDWDREYDEDLISYVFNYVELQSIIYYITFYGYIRIERGDLRGAESLVKKLWQIADTYENDDARICYYELASKLLIKVRRPKDTLEVTENGLDISKKTGQNSMVIWFLGTKANIELMLGDQERAESTLNQVRDLINSEGFVIPHFTCRCAMASVWLYLGLLEAAIRSDKIIIKLRSQALKSCKSAVKLSKTATYDRTEAYKLMGIYYWLIGKQSSALKWWDKSIKEGERLEANLELSRTYFEIGKRLLEKESKQQTMNGISAHDYLQKAEALFREMDLSWDLERVRKVKIEYGL